MNIKSFEKRCWWPIDSIINYNVKYCKNIGENLKILETGFGNSPFLLSTHFVDINSNLLDQIKNKDNFLCLDIDKDKYPFEENYFDFGYSRHTFEDIQNPEFAFQQFTKVCSSGFIETPSPLIECLHNVDGNILCDSKLYRGYIHHRYIIWTDKDNVLHFLPKYPIIEQFDLSIEDENNLINFVDGNELYWNNYYIWSKKDNKMPKYKIYKHGLNFDIGKDYFKLLRDAINSSFESTNLLKNNL